MRAGSTGDPGLSPRSRLVPTPLPRPGRAVIYLNIQVVKGQRKVICLLKEQISNVSAPLAPPPGAGGSPRGLPWTCQGMTLIKMRSCRKQR